MPKKYTRPNLALVRKANWSLHIYYRRKRVDEIVHWYFRLCNDQLYWMGLLVRNLTPCTLLQHLDRGVNNSEKGVRGFLGIKNPVNFLGILGLLAKFPGNLGFRIETFGNFFWICGDFLGNFKIIWAFLRFLSRFLEIFKDFLRFQQICRRSFDFPISIMSVQF